MTTSLAPRAADAPVTAASDPSSGLRRWTTAIALPAAFAAQLGANVIYASIADGRYDDTTGAGTLALNAAHPGAMQTAVWFALIGSLLVVPGMGAALRVLRPARPRFALAVGILIVAGYVAYFGINASGFYDIALATHGVDAAAAIDQAYRARLPLNIVFLAGNMLGTLLLGLVVLLGRGTVSRLAGVGILGWFVLHIVGLVAGSEWFEVAGGVLQVAGLTVLAAAAIRLPEREWRAQG